MRFAYADPPYLGSSQRLYGTHHDDASEYDRPEAHQALIERLVTEFPDGWALSLHTPSLKTILPMCPDDVRIMAWVKTWCSFKPNVNPAYAWEPVIVRGGRKRGREQITVRDWVAVPSALGKGLQGAKPAGFCYWIFDVLGAEPNDELEDLFPGSGAVTAAWEQWRRQPRLAI